MNRLAVKSSNPTARREARLRKLPRKKFVQWSVTELGGQWRMGWGRKRGFEGYIIVSPAVYRELAEPPLDQCRWHPVQARQKDKADRQDIDLFEAVMFREDREIGYFVAFGFTSGALKEIRRFFKRTGKGIKALTVRDILNGEIVSKLA